MTGFAHSKPACRLTPACGMAGTMGAGKGEPVLVKIGMLMCCQLTDSRKRSDRFQGRLAQQPDLAWLVQKLGLSLAETLQRV